jgi:4-oxalocrotonate tautomerase
MPLVRINLFAGQGPKFQQALSDAVHDAMVETINVPSTDRFQIITEHGPQQLVFPPEYLNIAHQDQIVFIQIFLNAGRTVTLKQALYAAIAARAAALGFDSKDLIINLVEVKKEDWSFGNGIAQYVPVN